MPRRRAPTNPFIIGHPAEGEHFANREMEVERIAKAFADPSSRLMVYGDRRLGKSSAVHRGAAMAREDGQAVAIVDLATATSATAAAQRVLAAVHREIGERWRDMLTRIVARLKGTVSITPSVDAQGNMSVSFAATPSLTDETHLFTDVLDAIEQELAARKLTLGLALDEFQRLQTLGGVEIDWPLKELLERHRRIAYVLAGSERTIIEQMIGNKKTGLWKLVDVLDMKPIEPQVLSRWLTKRAAATGLDLDAEAAGAIIQLAWPRTRDIVQLARAVWDLTHDRRTASRASVAEAMELLVREQSSLHARQWATLDEVARRILLVVAVEPRTPITAADTLERFRLGPKSTVHRVLNELVSGEVLVEQGSDGLAYDDPFFRRWVQVSVLEDIGRSAPALLSE
jgi:hypothetical protein